MAWARILTPEATPRNAAGARRICEKKTKKIAALIAKITRTGLVLTNGAGEGI